MSSAIFPTRWPPTATDNSLTPYLVPDSIRKVPFGRTSVLKAASGAEYRVAPASIRYRYEFRLEGLDATALGVVRDFFAARLGTLDSFQLEDPDSHTLVQVRFDMDELEFDQVSPALWGVSLYCMSVVGTSPDPVAPTPTQESDFSSAQVKATGAVSLRTLAARFADEVNVKDFGATGNGTDDDRDAFVAAMAASKAVYVPAGTYVFESSFTVPAQVVIRGSGTSRTTLQRAFTGDLITSQGDRSVLQDLTIDGVTATHGTGRGVLIPASSFGQQHRNVEIKNFSQAALEFGDSGGSEFKSYGCTYHTTGTRGTVAAVKGNACTGAVPRHFYGTASLGCTLFDFGQANHWWASGFYTNGLIFPSASAFNVELRQMRCGDLGGTIIVRGDSHFMSGVSAVPFDVRSTSSIYQVQCPGWEMFESGAAENNSIDLPHPTGGNVAWSPVWTGSAGGSTALGTGGTLVGRYSRRGAWLKVQLELTLGTGFSIGSGSWEFSIPKAAHASAPNQVCGSAYMQNGANTSRSIGVVQIAAGGTTMRVKTSTTDAGEFGPFTWDAGSFVRLTAEYRVT